MNSVPKVIPPLSRVRLARFASKTQHDALFHKHFLDRKFDEAFKAGRESMKADA
jgi:hypothetical protein